MSGIIINSPTTAGITTLYQAIANSKTYKKIKVFSTHEGALTWLNSYQV